MELVNLISFLFTLSASFVSCLSLIEEWSQSPYADPSLFNQTDQVLSEVFLVIFNQLDNNDSRIQDKISETKVTFSSSDQETVIEHKSRLRKVSNGSGFDEHGITTCNLRTFNYWNYTQGKANVVLGHEFDAAISLPHHFSSSSNSDNEVTHLHQRHNLRLLALLNPFFSHLRFNLVLAPRKTAISPADLTALPSSFRRLVVSQCSLVFVYAVWCPFSMRAAPYINALARAFPQLPVIAIDVDEYLQYRWSLRVFYVPKVKIFIGDHVYREFNGTDHDLDQLVEFIWKHLRLLPQGPLGLRREDFLGPIPTQLMVRKNDYRLPFMWALFLASSTYLAAWYFDWCMLLRRFKVAAQDLRRLLASYGLFADRRTLPRRSVGATAALPPPPPPPLSLEPPRRSHPHAD